MSPLRDALDDLVAEVPSHVLPDDLAGTAWRSGRRRRIRKRVAGSVGAVGIAAALVVAILPVVSNLASAPPASDPGDPGDPGGPGVTSYPQRIGDQWWVRDLPDRPGPAAGLIDLVDERDAWDKAVGWHVLSQGGHRWRLPAEVDASNIYPTLSPNGRYLGYLRTVDGPYVIHDLVTGEKTEFSEIGANSADEPAPFYVQGQGPSFWSPDGTRVLLFGGNWSTDTEDSQVDRIVVGVDGSLTHVKVDVGEWIGQAAGWASNDELVWVASRHADPDDRDSPVEDVVATITSVDGELRGTIELQRRSDVPWATAGLSQWGPVVHPGGKEILILDDMEAASGADYLVHRFSLSDGRATAEPVQVSDLASVCGASWAGERVTVPVYADAHWDEAITATIDGGQVQPLVVVEPGVHTRCIVWAGDALAGEANGGLFGMSTAWWTWWWREIVTGLVLIVVVGMIVWWRRRHRPSSFRRRTAEGVPMSPGVD